MYWGKTREFYDNVSKSIEISAFYKTVNLYKLDESVRDYSVSDKLEE